MAQIAEMRNGQKIIEFFRMTGSETMTQFRQRMHQAAKRKLRNPAVKEFSEVPDGEGCLCACGSGLKFLHCCIDKINQGEFIVGKERR